MKNDGRNVQKPVFYVLLAVFLIGAIYGLYIFGASMCPGRSFPDTLRVAYYSVTVTGIVVTVALVSLFVLLLAVCDEKGLTGKITDFLYRFRYPLGIVLLILCVVFKISGSSAACWESIIRSDAKNTGVLFGSFRTVRSDEYGTLLPITLSQYQDGFHYFSSIVRGTHTDVFIEYGAPVRDLAVIFRPFHWGYLFLSPERGLSFWWCGRMIFLALTSFDLGLLISKKQKIAFIFALFITLSPLTQWWAAVNGLLEMLIFGSAGVVLFAKILSSDKVCVKALCTLGLAVCLGGYALTMYPAWMIPLAYVLIGLVLWVLISMKERTKQVKKWIFWLLLAIVLMGAGVGYSLLKSKDTILAIMNTVYPGKRATTGGGYFWKYFQYTGNVFGGVSEFTNVCEFATLFTMAPLGLLLTLWVCISRKKMDAFMVIFLLLEFFFFAYAAVPFPMWLSKLTFLANSTKGRVTQLMGITDLLLLVRMLPEVSLKEKRDRYGLTSIFVLYAVFIFYANYHEYSWVLNRIFVVANYLIIIIAAVCLLFFLAGENVRRLGLAILTAILFFTGGLVNPVQKGLDCIYKNPCYLDIKEIVSEAPDALWIGEGVWLGDYLIMAGAKALNSTNIYPNTELWEKLDPDGSKEEVWNRYAHILLTISDEDDISLYQEDIIDFHAKPETLKELGITYLAALNPLEEFSTEEAELTLLKHQESYYLYRIE